MTEAQTPAHQSAPDPDETALFSFRVWNYKMGEVVSLMISLGDALGLYRALWGAGPLTAEELAERADIHPRWALEWLRGQAAADLLVHHDADDTFELTPEGAAVLADEEGSLSFAAGAFGNPPAEGFVDRLTEAFRTGIGLNYDDQGPAGAHRTERMLGPWSRIAFVPTIIPALTGVVDKLEAGAAVADVGCGAGVALRALAEAYPDSTFHGYDVSRHALDIARRRSAEDGLTNIEWIAAGGEELPAGADYDLVYTFDCIHDMTRPAEVIGAIEAALAADGTWLIKDIRSTGDFVADRKNPMLAMMYGFSVSSCMSSALSEPGGAGLGTLGFHPQKVDEMVRAAGFTRVTQHDFDDPANLYYEVRR